MRRFLPTWFMLFCISAPLGSAADVIGFVYSGGSYQMDGVGVRGNATLFDGSTVEIGEAAAKVQLTSGVAMWLAPKSRVSMSARGVRLLAGVGQFDASPEYWLEARAVRVASSQPHTTVRLALDETGGTVVAPLSGMVRVTNSRGVPVGELVKGSAVRFAGQAEAPSRVSVSGCLYAQGDRFGLTDAVTNVPIRLTGQGLQQEIGHVVDVSGVEGAAAADGLNVSVTAVRRLTSGPCVSGAAAGNAGLLAMAKPAEMTEQLQAAAPRLSLLVLEGEGAINNIKQRTAREPIVEVQDENHRPVAGALVLFALPRTGPSGTFANGATTLRVTTDAQGRAAARGLRPNNISGQFEIAVSASFAGLTAALVVRQVNTPAGVSGADSSTGGNSATTPRQVGQTAGQQSGRGGGVSTGAGGAGTGGGTTGTGGAGAGTGGGTTGTGGAGAGGAGAGGAGSSGAGVGLGIGSKIAIIGGITATAVVGGLAAAGTFGGGAEPAVSR